MKNLFLIVLSVLTAFSQIIIYRQSKSNLPNGVSVIYWMTDATPTRQLQVKGFQKWLIRKGLEPFEVRVDSANSELQKKIMQGISGTASDLIDCYTGDVHALADVGILEDLGDDEHQDFAYDPSVKADLFHEGKRYAFSRNLAPQMLIVNQDAFSKLGLPVPPARNDFSQFESIGRVFVQKANQGEKIQKRFFTFSLMGRDLAWNVILRSKGVSWFNETMTASTLNRSETVEVLKMLKRWMTEDHLMPSPAETSSLNVGQGFGGAAFQLLYHGQVGMAYSGLWSLVQVRQMGPPVNFTGIELPNGGFPNMHTGGGSVGVYRGGSQKEKAKLFLEYLLSEDFNRLIIDDADGLPTLPIYSKSPAFLQPINYPNEWSLRSRIAEASEALAVTYEYSPFCQHQPTLRTIQRNFEAYFSGIIDANGCAKKMQEDVNLEILNFVRRHPLKKSAFESAIAQQEQINQMKISKSRIPLKIVENPFLKKYYRFSGMGVE